MAPANRSGKAPLSLPNPIVDAVTGLLLGGLIGPLVGAGVSIVAVVLYLLSWLTIIGIPVGYLILMAGFPHGFWATWAATAVGGLVGGYRSSHTLLIASSDAPDVRPASPRDTPFAMAAGLVVALVVMIARLHGSHDWRQPSQFALALALGCVAGLVGGATGSEFVMAMNRRRQPSPPAPLPPR